MNPMTDELLAKIVADIKKDVYEFVSVLEKELSPLLEHTNSFIR